ncbi:MAG: SDR family oxidoreductase [Hyphomicrobiales bacterium]|nr:SDR family oxidoreductase [Hyphomicrobiales bacterium]
MDVSGKKALVFGGTSGIGLATTVRLADLGARVVAVSRNPDRTEVPAGVTLKACDVRDGDGVAALCADNAPYDVLISAATGGDRALGPFLDMDINGFKGSFDKLWGYANVVRFGTEFLTDTGAIVLVSGSPARRTKPGQISLASVGGAVEAFARSLAPEIAPRRINVVSPGIIDTPMFGPDSPERTAAADQRCAAHMIPRAGTPDEVAQGIIFLVQNDFVTGTTVDIDGGWLHS